MSRPLCFLLVLALPAIALEHYPGNAAEFDLGAAQARHAAAEDELAAIGRDLQRSQRHLRDVEHDHHRMHERLDDIERQCGRLQNAHNANNNRLKQLLSQLSSTRAELTAKQAANAPESELAVLRNRITQIDRERSTTQTTINRDQQRLRQLESDAASCKNRLHRIERDVHSARLHHNRIVNAHRQADAAHDALAREEQVIAANVERARAHIAQAAARYGAAGEDEGKAEGIAQGARDAERPAQREGAEMARRDALATARLAGAVAGKEAGIEAGRALGSKDGQAHGERDGRAQGLAERGFADAIAHFQAEPIADHPRYVSYHERGQQQAQSIARRDEYPRGRAKAEKDFYSAALKRQVIDNASAPVFERKPAANLPPRHTPPAFRDYAFDIEKPSVALPTPANRQGQKPDSFPGHRDFQATPDAAQTVRSGQESLAVHPAPPAPRLTLRFQHLDPAAVRYPHPALQAEFDDRLREAYATAAGSAFADSYSRSYQTLFRDRAGEVYRREFAPQRYVDAQAESQAASRNYWRQRAELETFQSIYPNAYAAARRAARDQPDASQSHYMKAYNIGTAYAAARVGYDNGYETTIEGARDAAFKQGYDARSLDFQDHAVLNFLEAQLVDENDDGVFAVGEKLSVRIELKNFGLRSPQPGELGAVLELRGGSLEPLMLSQQLGSIDGQTHATFEHVAAARISPYAHRDERLSFGLAIYHQGHLLGRRDLHAVVSHPLAFTDLSAPPKAYTNSPNEIRGRVVNNSKRPVAGVKLRVQVGQDVRIAQAPLPTLQPGESAPFAVPFAVSDAMLFERVTIRLQGDLDGVLQAVSGPVLSFVSKLPGNRAPVLLVADDFGQLDLREMRHWLLSANSEIDILEPGAQAADVAMFANRDYLALAVSRPTPAMLQGASAVLERGGDVLMVCSPLAATPDLHAMLARHQITLDDALDGRELNGQHFLLAGKMRGLPLRVQSLKAGDSKTRMSYELVEGAPRGFFRRRPSLAVRQVPVEQMNALTVLGFALPDLPSEEQAELIGGSFLMRQPMAANVALFASVRLGERNAALRGIILGQLFEEIDKDELLRKRLYNPRYTDTSGTRLYQFQQAVLALPDSAARRELIGMVSVLDRKLRSKYGEEILSDLRALKD